MHGAFGCLIDSGVQQDTRVWNSSILPLRAQTTHTFCDIWGTTTECKHEIWISRDFSHLTGLALHSCRILYVCSPCRPEMSARKLRPAASHNLTHAVISEQSCNKRPLFSRYLASRCCDRKLHQNSWNSSNFPFRSQKTHAFCDIWLTITECTLEKCILGCCSHLTWLALQISPFLCVCSLWNQCT